MPQAALTPILWVMNGEPVTDERKESLMDQTGLGLLPGLALALGLVVLAMAFLLIGSMWAVVGVLALVAVVTGVILAVVFALLDEDSTPAEDEDRMLLLEGEKTRPDDAAASTASSSSPSTPASSCTTALRIPSCTTPGRAWSAR